MSDHVYEVDKTGAYVIVANIGLLLASHNVVDRRF